jgi:hypothetical protein
MLVLLSGPRPALADSVKDDERVLLFPTSAYRDPAGEAWVVPIHGWIFEPEESSLWRRAAVESLAAALGLGGEALDNELFRQRAPMFLVDNERGKRLEIRVAGRGFLAEASEPNGHFFGLARIPPDATGEIARDGWLDLEVALRDGDRRRFAGMSRLLAPRGLSVISDIDDTIKVSNVTDKRELLANTFLRPFKSVPGMAALYRDWARAGAAFHYVSSSPWQLYPALSAFLEDAGFPAGSTHLRNFRVKDESFLELFGAPDAFKLPTIEALLARHPERGFVLVGDSSERDPEIYAEIARRHRGQVRHVFIREVPEAGDARLRVAAAFAGLPENLWTLFRAPDGLSLEALARP